MPKEKELNARLTKKEQKLLDDYKNGLIIVTKEAKNIAELKRLRKQEAAFKSMMEMTSQKGKFEMYHIKPTIEDSSERECIPIIQNSDNHIDEVVLPETVMGMNEYNFEIAQQRSDTFYSKIVQLISHHQSHYNIKQIVFAYLGDSIGGWIHDELAQTNSMSPGNAIHNFKNMTIAGLQYLHDNLNVEKITVVMVCGNHSRATKKVQFANFADTNLEYFMYLDIQNICKKLGLNKFEFIIPKAEMAILEILGKRILFAHGNQFKYAGGIGGIFPSMLRWFASVAKALEINIAFIGHWHQAIFTKRVIVNGSMKGYDSYALSHGLDFETPSQNLVLLDSKYGFCLFQQIFL
jgi:predicted phosphodiesterase